MNSHASPTGVASQPLQLKDYCAGGGTGHGAKSMPHTHTHTPFSLFHMAPRRRRSALSQGKIRECGKAWEPAEECAPLRTPLNGPEDNHGGHGLSPQQGGPRVRRAQATAQSPNWASEAEFTHQPTNPAGETATLLPR